MNYRTLFEGEMVSALGFGCMRLPTRNEGDKKCVDREKAIPMIRYAIDNGVNYVDTAYGYHDGESEVVVGEALKGGYREKVTLATKLPPWRISKTEDMRRVFDEQRERLGTDVIDVYLLHALNKQSFEAIKGLGVFAFLDELLKEGSIKHAGFSFHDGFETFKEIIDAYPFDICQIQMNYMDINEQATLEGMRYAKARGLTVVDMEPLRGGILANVPGDVKAIFDTNTVRRAPVDWALRYMLNFPEVATVLSGMGTMEQVKENIGICSDAEAGCMTETELRIIEDVRACFEGREKVPCTECDYCLPCPQNISISRIFGMYNEAAVYDTWDGARSQYKRRFQDGGGAGDCTGCGECEERCPQKIAISDRLKEAGAALSPA